MGTQCNVIWLRILGTVPNKCALYQPISLKYCWEEGFPFSAKHGDQRGPTSFIKAVSQAKSFSFSRKIKRTAIARVKTAGESKNLGGRRYGFSSCCQQSRQLWFQTLYLWSDLQRSHSLYLEQVCSALLKIGFLIVLCSSFPIVR